MEILRTLRIGPLKFAPSGFEVVEIEFDGDAFPWTIERKN